MGVERPPGPVEGEVAEVAEASEGAGGGRSSVELGGYQQELKRTLGSFQVFVKLITGSTILPAIIYGATIILYLVVRRRLGRQEGAFHLGRFELPVTICALVWSVASLFVLVAPEEALVPALIVVGLLLAGGLFFLALLRFNRAALETEPGDVNVFTH